MKSFAAIRCPSPLIVLVSLAAAAALAAQDPGAGAAAPASAAVEARVEGERAAIGNRFLSFDISLAGRKVQTKSILNRITEEATALEGDDFVIIFQGGKKKPKGSEFHLEASAAEDGEGDARRLVFRLTRDDIRVRYIFEMHPGQWWARRWLEIEAASGQLEKVSLSEWQCENAWGPSGPGKTADGLGAPEGLGQPAFVNDLFLALEHPGAENFARGKRLCCRLGASDVLGKGPVRTRPCIVGAGEAGGAGRAFLRFIDTRRANPAHMIFLANDWYWSDKSRTVEAIASLAKVKQETGVPIDSFTLDDGWDGDWNEASGIWGRLNGKRFPGGWDALAAAGRSAGMGVSLWFGPIGGYGGREERVAFGKTRGFETYGDKLCLAGTKYGKHAIESFSAWAQKGMDYIKVDGFWPECPAADHGHGAGPGAMVAQMDAIIEVFAAWRRARPGLPIGYTSGSSPSPFWLEHCDWVWRGGADDSHAGEGEPFDRHNTYIDGCLQVHRPTDMPVSAFVIFDIVQGRIAGGTDEVFERGAWWLAARTSLHHDWYIQAGDLTPARWRILAKAAHWAKAHEKVFRFGRSVGGDPRQGDIYGYSAFDAPAGGTGSGTLALRNPGAAAKTLEKPLHSLLGLPLEARKKSYRLTGVHGETHALEGVHGGRESIKAELPPFAVAVFEVEEAR